MRTGAARSVVDALVRGDEVEKACRAALADAAELPDPFRAELRVLALNQDGRHGAAAGQPGATYAVMTATSSEPEVHPRSVL